MGSAVDSFSLLLFKTFTPVALLRCNSIEWRRLPHSSNEIEVESRSNESGIESIETIRNLCKSK